MPSDLLTRLVEHERWPSGRAVLAGMPGGVFRCTEGMLWRWIVDLWRWLPDPTDAATGGVLLAMVYAEDPDAAVGRSFLDDDVGTCGWYVEAGLPCRDQHRHTAATLGEACVQALAALWGVR